MVRPQDQELYRRDVHAGGKALSVEEREALVRPYLPAPPEERDAYPFKSSSTKSKRRPQRTRRIRTLLRHGLHLLIYHAIQLIFGIYIRLRQTYRAIRDRVLGVLYYHHRTPDLIKKDVKSLDRLPEHLSVILHLRGEEEGGLERLMDEVAELSAWCASTGIPLLSVYEKTGILKSIIPHVHANTKAKLAAYFGPAPHTPHLKVTAPHHSSFSPSSSPSPTPSVSSEDSLSISSSSLTLLLLSASDGRDTLVDLTRTLTEMAQTRKISPKDISTSLIDAEISETTRTPFLGRNAAGESFGASSGEPDLLLIFGPDVHLDGYPPWQVRLTEIFCTRSGSQTKPVKSKKSDSTKGASKPKRNAVLEQSSRLAGNVDYQGFIRALWKYAGAEMRFGR